jgi:ABC-type transport system involved in Fe-S cluster assembly fused permease/ATPase subunit
MFLSGRRCWANWSRQKFPFTSDVSVRFAFTSPFSTHFNLFLLLFCSTVELSNGKIEIDGCNIRSVGLDVLRRGLALVPQDSTLFLGTLRDNL